MSKTLQRNLEAELSRLDADDSTGDDEPINNVGNKKKESKRKANHSGKEKPNKRATNDTGSDSDMSSVIYLGHLPHAFEEAQLLTFFSQFGTVTDVKLSRSKRSGNSQGFAFVKFSDEDVASVVAKAMDGYFMMGEKRLVCHVLPKVKVTERMFYEAKRNLKMNKSEVSMSSIKKWQDMSRRQVNSKKSTKSMKKITQRLLKREQAKREKISKLGIDYEFPGYSFGGDEGNKNKVDAEHGENQEAKIKSKKGSSNNKSEKTNEIKKSDATMGSLGSATDKERNTTPVKDEKIKDKETDTKVERTKSGKKKKKADKNINENNDKVEAGSKRGNVEADTDEDATKGKSNKKLKKAIKTIENENLETSAKSDNKELVVKSKKTPKKKRSDSNTTINATIKDKNPNTKTDDREKLYPRTPIKNSEASDKNESQSLVNKNKSKVLETKTDSDQKTPVTKAKKTPKKKRSDSDKNVEKSIKDESATTTTENKGKSTPSKKAMSNLESSEKNESKLAQTPSPKDKSTKKAMTEVKKKKKSKKKKSRRQST